MFRIYNEDLFFYLKGCGKQAIQPDLSNLFRIVGGKEAVPYSWPWAAILKTFGQFYCGATLINNQWVMTAAHCKKSISSLRVQMGIHDQWSFPIVDETVSKWISHPEYDSNTIFNDIALVKLANPVYLSDQISPACLPNGRSSEPGEEGFVIGWVSRNDLTCYGICLKFSKNSCHLIGKSEC